MADPLTIAAGVGTGLKAVSGLFGGGGETVEGLQLPPELELDMLNKAQATLDQLTQSKAQVDQLMETYNQRINTIQKGIEGTIPEKELLQQLSTNSAQIALSLGAGAEDLVNNGFLDADDIARIEELDALQAQDFTDEALEQQISQERDRLEQELFRSGASATERAIALQAFESDARVERQQRTEIMRQGAFERGLATLTAQSGLRQQGFQNVLGGLGAQQGILQGAQASLGNLAQLNQAQLETGFQGIGFQNALGQQQQSLFNQLAEYDLSGRTKQALSAGQVGPGSFQSQLGQPDAGALTQGSQNSLQMNYANQLSRLSDEQLRNQYALSKSPGQQNTNGPIDRTAAIAQEFAKRGQKI